jgi:hypothetical protein
MVCTEMDMITTSTTWQFTRPIDFDECRWIQNLGAEIFLTYDFESVSSASGSGRYCKSVRAQVRTDCEKISSMLQLRFADRMTLISQTHTVL